MVTTKPVNESSCVCKIPGNARIFETKIFDTCILKKVDLTLRIKIKVSIQSYQRMYPYL